MRKYFILNLLVAVLMGVAFVSCKDEQPKVNSNTDLLFLYYLGDGEVGPGYHFYRLSLVTKGSRDLTTGLSKTEGKEYRFLFSSGGYADVLAPTVGEYSLGTASDDFTVMTFHSEQSFVRVFDKDDNTVGGEARAIVEGKFTIESNKLMFKGKDSEGDDIDIVFGGDYVAKIEDVSSNNPWKYEPKTSTSHQESFTKADFTNHFDYLGNDTRYFYVAMKKQEGQTLIVGGLGFILNKTANQIAPGTYIVADSKAEGTLYKSPGTIGDVVKGCCLIYQRSLNEVFYIASGTAVVTTEGISFEGKSHFGSDIKFNYTGEIPYLGPDRWELEPKEKTTKSEEFTQGNFEDYNDFFKNGTKMVYATLTKQDDSGNSIQGAMMIVLDKDATSIVPGTYNIDGTREAGTFFKSVGRVDGFATGVNLWYFVPTAVYFVESGTAIVTDSGIEIVGKSHFGSDITIKYTGSMAF